MVVTFAVASNNPQQTGYDRGSELLDAEGIATRDLSRFQAGHEPTRALCRRAVRECIRHDVTLRLSLQSIVANSRRCLHCSFDIASLNKLPFFLRPVRPNAGETICLQLHPDLHAIGVGLAHATLRLLHLGQQPKQILHVVTDLVRNHVGLRELAGLAAGIAGAKPSLKILKETCVELLRKT
jgi:hypothetical protein